MRASHTATPGTWSRPPVRRCLAALSLVLSCLAPVRAQEAPPAKTETPDLWITVFSEPGKDLTAVAYNAETPDRQIKQDFAEVAANLGINPPKVKITRAGGIPAAEGELSGLADWKTGATNLNPLIQTYRRYGRFRVSFFFMGNFPQQGLLSFNQPPLRVEGERTGNTIHYRIVIDQSKGVPQAVPTVSQTSENGGRNLILGIAAVAAVVAVAVFLVVYVILGQRRRQAAGPERPAGQPGSAASSSPGEGKSI